ncbi:MAG TPA: hypothetical protein VI386_19120 [Candidatus Sulfotelmatobacter sp.]
MLPLLTVLFLLSYGLMTMLIVEQGSTIDSQRVLIRELFRDSTELSASKNKAIQEKNAVDAKRRSEQQGPLSKGQSQTTQAPAGPSNQVNPQSHSEKKQKQQLTLPSRPASDLADDRRALISI